MSKSVSWLSLDADEEMVWRGGPRLQVVLWLAVPALIAPLLAVLLGPTVVGLVVGALVWVAISYLAYVYVTNIEYVVSTRYAYAKRGVFGRSVTQVGLHNIQDTTLTQGILGTQFDYGTVRFSTAGGEGATLGFYMIDDPGDVKRTIDGRISTAREETGTESDEPDGRVIDDLFAEAEAMRSAAQRIDRTLEHQGERR